MGLKCKCRRSIPSVILVFFWAFTGVGRGSVRILHSGLDCENSFCVSRGFEVLQKGTTCGMSSSSSADSTCIGSCGGAKGGIRGPACELAFQATLLYRIMTIVCGQSVTIEFLRRQGWQKPI